MPARIRRLSTLCAALALLAGPLLAVDAAAPPPAAAGVSAIPAGETDEPGEEDEEEEGGPAAPNSWFLRQRAQPGQTMPRGAYQRAQRQARELRSGADPQRDWQLQGPRTVGGRVVDMAVDTDEPGTVYAAAATGGVWKSTDAGTTFTSAWDDSRTQSMGALEAAPDGTLYAGTGEPNMGGGSVVYPGTGLYRSSDDGRSWQQAGLNKSGTIGDIVVDPQDSQRLFVAASGPIFDGGGQRGVYRSTDGGRSHELVLPAPNPTTGAIDIAMDPSDPDTLYASMWDRIRYPDLRRYGGPGSGVYRSSDGGDSWQRLGGGLPEPDDGLGRIGIALAPSQPDRVYAIVIDRDGAFEGFYRSDDAGSHWRRSPRSEELADSQSSFGWWFGKVWVDPADADHLFAAGVPLAESRDGGASWRTGREDFHADQHAMTWSPHVPGRVYLGNDGGVYRSESGGSIDRGWADADVQPFTQFYTAAVSRQDPSRISGGAQDNGSVRSWGGDRWNGFLGGDGLQNLINPQDQQTVYACYQYGNCFRSEDGGETLSGITEGTVSDRRQWQTPLEFDPSDPSTLYYAGNRVNRSTDEGRSWEAISPDLTGGPGRGENYPYGTVTALAVAPGDPDRIYAGTDDARVWTTADGGQHWTRLDTGGTLPEQWVTSLTVSPRHPGTVYVTYSGYRSGSDAPHVFVSTDAGASWHDRSSNLPDAPVNDLELHPFLPGTMYAATDVGVFRTADGGQSWQAVGGAALPLAPVTELEFHLRSMTLTAATFGRGIYRIDQRP